MKHAEKKYRVDSFNPIQEKLTQLGAVQTKTDSSLHLYAQHSGSGVVKLVIYKDRSEIHVLDESNGTFSLREKIAVDDKQAGLRWLKDRGYSRVDVVNMTYTDYDYKEGIVGLYTINDTLHSVILDFPVSQHAAIEQELGLTTAPAIDIPYNRYLQYYNGGKERHEQALA